MQPTQPLPSLSLSLSTTLFLSFCLPSLPFNEICDLCLPSFRFGVPFAREYLLAVPWLFVRPRSRCLGCCGLLRLVPMCSAKNKKESENPGQRGLMVTTAAPRRARRG
uniref:Putative secreted protein n=1 Tax=Anopheles darlingi TaxID=43151 RepID=A0A2M4DNR6_ANODA